MANGVIFKMTTATKAKSAVTTQNLAKPTVCKKCSATHFTYSLTCKRCGDYLDKKDAISESGLGGLKLAASMIAVVVGILVACLIFKAI
jgi:hypothetical protein